jgi:hypothetical protein
LYENGYENIEIVRMFREDISARAIGIMASKKE